MKQIFYTVILIFVLVQCKKEPQHQNNFFLQEIKKELKCSLSATDFSNLDFNRVIYSGVDSIDMHLVRIPFKDEEIKNHFVLVKTRKNGSIQQGKIISMQGERVEKKEGDFINLKWEGEVSIYSLNRKEVLHSPVKDGYILAFHKEIIMSRSDISLVAPDNTWLPEVIVVGYITTSGIHYADYMFLQNLLATDSGGYGSYGSYYTSMDGGGGGYSYSYDGSYYGGSYTGGGGGGYIYNDPPILIDYENQDIKDAIDLEKFINCFNAIPDAGANCSIEIFSDIPVDNDPYKIFEFNTGSPGHVFIQIKKSNGSQSAIQNIGFYPKSGIKAVMTNAPIDAKFVDNGQHEYNISLKMNLSPENFKSTLTEILYLRNSRYDIDNYNCTDWALDVFNKTRTSKINVPLYAVPGFVPSTGTRTPQGLYNKLKEMKNQNHPESANITSNIVKGWVANSKGPCN